MDQYLYIDGDDDDDIINMTSCFLQISLVFAYFEFIIAYFELCPTEKGLSVPGLHPGYGIMFNPFFLGSSWLWHFFFVFDDLHRFEELGT